MSYISDSLPLYRILPCISSSNKSTCARSLYYQAKDILERIAFLNFIHGDLSKFNLMVSDLNLGEDMAVVNPKLILIDFPQMINCDHKLANTIYERDAKCVENFSSRYFDILSNDLLSSLDSIRRSDDVDVRLKAPGYISKNAANCRFQHTLDDLPLGTVARLQLSSSENNESASDGYESRSGSINFQENGQLQSECDEESHSEGTVCDDNSKDDLTSSETTDYRNLGVIVSSDL
ncbi:hypothetical protein MN116_003218 [Schistosoma mekongi]|uniref:non-specific serine/threonine protein kinase n=1 Tax=Schistosoma mekongi TaxID=38744 RepID=A0AAE2D8D9_SCHME|nr:hypothetical protein MN116_003218 [Schistosoma mekongi]